MTKPLTVLVITRGNNSDADVTLFRRKVARSLPEGTKIQYALPGNVGAGAFVEGKQARNTDYDYIILSPKVANYFGTPAVLEGECQKPLTGKVKRKTYV